jgi:Protein of unknown function (DUF3313)
MTGLMAARLREPLVLVMALTVLIGACTATRARRGAPEAAGFLGDYSNLQNNPQYPAALVYVKPNVQWGKYSAIQLESAGLYGTDQTKALSPEDQERLAGMLYNTMTQELEKYFTVVKSPAPNTLRVRMALTQAQGSQVALRTVTTVVPQLRMASTATGLASDTAATVGAATAEMEAQDSVSGERVAAAVDARAGTKALFAGRSYEKWGDVQAAIDYWSKRVAWQLSRQGVQLKAGVTAPEEPKEPRSF